MEIIVIIFTTIIRIVIFFAFVIVVFLNIIIKHINIINIIVNISNIIGNVLFPFTALHPLSSTFCVVLDTFCLFPV